MFEVKKHIDDFLIQLHYSFTIFFVKEIFLVVQFYDKSKALKELFFVRNNYVWFNYSNNQRLPIYF